MMKEELMPRRQVLSVNDIFPDCNENVELTLHDFKMHKIQNDDIFAMAKKIFDLSEEEDNG